MYTEGGDGTHTRRALTANRQRVQQRQRLFPTEGEFDDNIIYILFIVVTKGRRETAVLSAEEDMSPIIAVASHALPTLSVTVIKVLQQLLKWPMTKPMHHLQNLMTNE
jgi:hypothetical protein